ncbi:MAG: hypothetical protein K0S20_710 [Patescibacteria group bacterium]|jgi:predicted RNA-binding protein with PUA-like domain|nr:hypothetical protein [Patescibacteria group bacterium]
MQYWLMKTEPGCYSIDDLARDGSTEWNGIRNYQARNFLRDQVKKGDLVLLYHSIADPAGIAGIAEVCSDPHPDSTAFDPSDEHFDPKSSKENPTWITVDLAFKEKFPTFISLEQIKSDPQLEGIIVARKGSRLSVMPVEERHFQYLCARGRS